MIFGSKHKETAKLGSQRITVKSSEVGQPPLLAESSVIIRSISEEDLKENIFIAVYDQSSGLISCRLPTRKMI